jgi:hypothetical protein
MNKLNGRLTTRRVDSAENDGKIGMAAAAGDTIDVRLYRRMRRHASVFCVYADGGSLRH